MSVFKSGGRNMPGSEIEIYTAARELMFQLCVVLMFGLMSVANIGNSLARTFLIGWVTLHPKINLTWLPF